MDLRTLTIMGFLCKVYVHLTLNGYQRLPIQITEFVNNHYIGWNLNISGITPNPKFMGFALMGAMPSMIMRCLGGPLWSLNLPALGRGILLAVYEFHLSKLINLRLWTTETSQTGLVIWCLNRGSDWQFSTRNHQHWMWYKIQSASF